MPLESSFPSIAQVKYSSSHYWLFIFYKIVLIYSDLHKYFGTLKNNSRWYKVRKMCVQIWFLNILFSMRNMLSMIIKFLTAEKAHECANNICISQPSKQKQNYQYKWNFIHIFALYLYVFICVFVYILW